MCSILFALCVCMIIVTGCKCQVVQFGTCADNVATKKYFNLESIEALLNDYKGLSRSGYVSNNNDVIQANLATGSTLNKMCGRYYGACADTGFWYEIERFPVWYEQYGNCAYKRIQYCERRIEIEHGYIRDEIHFILHLNSTYVPGDEAVFNIQENNIDPVGIPLTVISTDYTNYAVIYGCKHNEELGIKYIAAWILSREPILSDSILMKAYRELNSIPYANLAYLEEVEQKTSKCQYHWTAHVHAENKTQDYS